MPSSPDLASVPGAVSRQLRVEGYQRLHLRHWRPVHALRRPLFGGLGIPLPGPFKTAIVPAAGFTQEPPQVKNLGALLIGGKAHIPTTLDFAVRVTQRDNPHFAFDIGIGEVAGQIGTTFVYPLGLVPVNLHARNVVGMGLSLRY